MIGEHWKARGVEYETFANTVTGWHNIEKLSYQMVMFSLGLQISINMLQVFDSTTPLGADAKLVLHDTSSDAS